MAVELVPSIDETRAYQRGTWACHAGGMVSAFPQTRPGPVTEENGWRVTLNGIAEIEFDQSSDQLTICIAMRLTSADIHLKTFKSSGPLFLGNLKSEREGVYVKGDGSLWACSS